MCSTVIWLIFYNSGVYIVRHVTLGGHTPIFDCSVRITQKSDCFDRVFDSSIVYMHGSY